MWVKCEDTLRTKLTKQSENLQKKAKHLSPLEEGDHCHIQNQTGRFPRKWDKTGLVVQVNGNDQYAVKVDGTGRLTLGNRKYLRKFQPIPHATIDKCPHQSATASNQHLRQLTLHRFSIHIPPRNQGRMCHHLRKLLSR